MRNDDNNPPDPQEIVRQTLHASLLEDSLKQTIDDEFEKRREWFMVTYQGYDSSRGLHKIKKIDGSIMYAQVKSMPSSVSIGSSLVAFCSRGRYAQLFLPL